MSLQIKHVPQISYSKALELMMQLHDKRVKNEIPNTILVLEHDPVITKGRRLHGQDLPNQTKILEKGVEIHEADRGGLLTYHGPGQIVMYFIVKVEDYFKGIQDMVHSLEEGMLSFFEEYGFEGKAGVEHPGIWIQNKKVASIGLRVSQGITRHGIAVNIKNDLSVYELFDPCGLSGNTMGHLQGLMNHQIHPEQYNEICSSLEKHVLKKF